MAGDYEDHFPILDGCILRSGVSCARVLSSSPPRASEKVNIIELLEKASMPLSKHLGVSTDDRLQSKSTN